MLLRLSLVLLLVVMSSCATRLLTAKQRVIVASPTPARPSNVPSDWKRTEVKDKFVFYMPANMKADEEMDMADTYGPGAFYTDSQLRWNYGYATVDLCQPTPEWLSNDPTHRETELDIGGRRANGHTWTSQTSGHHFIVGCLSDIDGYGTNLHVGASSKDERALDVARQIFASIQFRKGAT
jgi:hypothetical protein